jgi:glycosyltransferase involved in cell wall biosynthesis
MHLIALVESKEHVCARYRLRAFDSLLERAGHALELERWPDRWWERLLLARMLRRGDAVIVQRKLLAAWQLALVRRSATRLLFDFDDAVFLRDSYSPRGLHSSGRLRRFAAIVSAADAVLAGNDYLAEHARRWTTSERVYLVPTYVDPSRYSLAEHLRANQDVQIVWIGSSSTLQGLEATRPLLEELGRRLPGLRLKMICDRFLEFRHLPVIACPWSEKSEAAEISSGDIGISWMPDDAWSLGKCGLKVLQYMAAGLPVVANPVGVQGEMVKHGESGFLVRSADEWTEAVGRLMADPELRRRMGAAGRRRVEMDFSVQVGAARWIEILAKLAHSTPRSASA